VSITKGKAGKSLPLELDLDRLGEGVIISCEEAEEPEDDRDIGVLGAITSGKGGTGGRTFGFRYRSVSGQAY